MKIAPSILACDFGHLAEEIRAVEEGGADWIHVDVMDGHFVPNLTLGPAVVRAARRATDLPLDVHLMIEHPERYLEAFVDAGAHLVTVHAEACPRLPRVLRRIRELGARAGLAVSPPTAVASVREALDEIDLLLVMSVHPGFAGQAFIEGSVEKVRRARALLDEVGGGVELEVDGGVDASNAGVLAGAGATVLVAGSAVYGHPDGAAAGVGSVRAAAGG